MKKRRSWIDSDLRKLKKLSKELGDKESAVNIIDKETEDVGGAEQLSFPSEYPAGEQSDNENGSMESLYHMPRQAEYGQTLTDLTTERHTSKPNQRVNTQHGMWEDSYKSVNQFEGGYPPDKMGEEDIDPLSEAVYPPYTDGIGQPNPRYEDANKEKHNIILHAQKYEDINPNKGPDYSWVAIDLDGTILEPPSEGIYQDKSGKHLFGKPIKGAMEALQELINENVKVSIYTARQYFTKNKQQEDDLKEAISTELDTNGIPYSEIYVGKKLPAHVYLDDRNVPFDGDWVTALNEIKGRLIKKADTLLTAQDLITIYEYYYKISKLEDKKVEEGLGEEGQAIVSEMRTLLAGLLKKAILFLKENVYKNWLLISGDPAFAPGDPDWAALVYDIRSTMGKLIPTGNIHTDMATFSIGLNQVHSTGKMMDFLSHYYGIPKELLDELTAGSDYTQKWDREIRKVAEDEVKDKKNYKGIKIDVEWPKGSIRSYKGDDTYVTHMKCDYGFASGIEGADTEGLDVYLMDGDSEIAYIIEQLKDDQSYDEDKVVLGAQSEEEAVDMYLKHLPGYMFGDIREVPIEKLVNALYGEPEDRRGQEDLIPSEEKKAEQTKKSFKMSAGLKYMAGKKSGEKVGLFIPLPPELAKQYPIKGRAGEDDSDPHMTLLYIGDVPEGQFDRLEQIVREELVRTGPFEIELLPPDEFTNQHDQRILHSPIKSEFLTGLHDVIKQRLLDDGFKLKNPDRPFKGHVTIEYVDPGEESKFDNVNPSGSWIVNEIEIWGMGDPRIIKLDNAGDMQMVAMLKQAAYADMALKIINDMDNQSTMQWLAKYTDINVDIKDLSNNIVRLMLMNNKFMKEVKDQYGEIPVHKMIFPEKKIKDVGPTGTQVLHMNSQKMHKLPDGSGFFTALVGNDKEADTFDPKINKKTKSDYVGPGTSQVGGIGGPTADAPQSNYLFVYGTLRKGEPNHHFLENAKFLGAIKTMPKYELITAEDSPGLVEGGINSIIGELYQVSDECLAEVDAFEQPYERILITLEDGRDACSYVFPHTKDHWVEEAPHSDKESGIAFPGSIDDSFMKNEIDPLETRESRDISRPADQERLKYRHA